jgi:Leucine-rich repeat (LRR) protein
VTGSKEEEARREVEKLGGACEVDEKGRLRTVSLSGPRFTDAVMDHLKGLTKLERLYLVKTHVSDDGLEHLKGRAGLRTLDLSFTQVSDAGLEHLKGLTGLERLWLQQPRLTDKGRGNLTGLIGLRTLDLRFTQVTDVGTNELRNALPKCRIHR